MRIRKIAGYYSTTKSSASSEFSSQVENVLVVSKTNLERFAASTKLLLVDTTFSTNNFNAPVAVFASKDAMDMVYIVALAILSSSTPDSFKWALSNFVEAISPQTASQVEVLFTDRKRAGSC